VTGSRIFQLRTLQVAGNMHLSTVQVAELAGLTESTNVFWFSSARAERRLESNPWVASATVSRTLPGEVKVVIRERSPVAVASIPSGLRVLVAADGTVLGRAGRGALLPAIAASSLSGGAGARMDPRTPALAVAAALPASLRARVSGIEVAKGDQITLKLAGGAKVLFGDPTAAAAKSESLMAVLSWADQNGVRPAYVDVRAPAAPALLPAGRSTAGSPVP
jgi:cell division protein FtsQ